MKGPETEQGAIYGYYSVLPYKHSTGGTGLWAVPLVEIGGFAGSREGARGRVVSTRGYRNQMGQSGNGSKSSGESFSRCVERERAF